MLEIMEKLWFLLLGPLTFLFVIWSFFSWSGARGENRDLPRLERKLNAMMKHLGIDYEAVVKSQVQELVKQGKKGEAIAWFCENLQKGPDEAEKFLTEIKKK